MLSPTKRKTLAPSTSPVKPKPVEEKSVSVIYEEPIPTPDTSTSLKASTLAVGVATVMDGPPAYTIGSPVALQTVPVVHKQRGDIEPKVFLPHERTTDRPPRQIEVEKKRQFESANVGSLVTSRLEKLFQTPEFLTLTDASGSAKQLLEAMPLHWFDDKSFEVREPEEWITCGKKKDGSVAIPVTAFHSQPGQPGRWIDGHVIGYNASRAMFLVRSGNQEDFQLHRIDICFKAEDPIQFVERVAAAHRARLIAQSEIRKNIYIDCMPSDDLHKLGTENVNKILKLASVPFVAKGVSVPETSRLVSEVHTDYLRTMSRIVFEHQQKHKLSSSLDFALVRPQDDDCNKRRRLMVDHQEIAPPIDYADQFIGFSFQTFLTSPETLSAVTKVNEECYRMLCMDIFALKTTRSLKLEEFQQRQNTQERTIHKIVHDDWPSKLTHAIKTSLIHVGKGWYNLQETRRDTYEFSKLRSFLRRVNLTMKDTLRYMSEQSLHSFRSFIEKAAEANVKIIDAKTTVLSYADLESKWARRDSTLFTLNLSISSELIVINQYEIDLAKGEIAEWKAAHAAKMKKLAEEDPDGHDDEECPIRVVEPVMGNSFGYTTPISAFGQAVIDVFNKSIDSFKDIKQVEQMVMDKLFWSSHPSIPYVNANEDWVVKLRESVHKLMEKSERPLRDYLKQYERYIGFLNLDEEKYLDQFRSQDPPNLQELTDRIKQHGQDAVDIEDAIPATNVELGMYSVSCATMRSQLAEKHRRLARRLLDCHLVKCVNLAKELHSKFEPISRQLQKIPTDIEQLTEMNKYIESIPSQLAPLLASSQMLIKYRSVLDSFQYRMDKDDFMTIWRVRLAPNHIHDQVHKMNNILVMENQQFLAEMRDQQVEFNESLRLLHQEVDGFKQYTDLARVEQVYKYVINIDQKIVKAEEDARLFNSREVLFHEEMSDYDEISRIRRDFEPYSMLWKTANNWIKDHKKWMDGPFLDIAGEEFEQFVESNWTTITKATKYFEKMNIKGCLDIANHIKNEIAAFRPHVPLVLALRNPGMQERHWLQMNQETHMTFRPDRGMKLSYVLGLGLDAHIDTITKICETAGKEYQIEKALNAMEEQWKHISLTVVEYRETGTFVLKAVDEVQAILDEQITITQAMQFSAFKKPFEERINKWEKCLSTVSDVLEEWMAVQRAWLYLQPIFDSPDINKQLPMEGKRFATVDKNWRQTLQGAKAKPSVLNFCNNDKLLDRFQESNKFLEQVQKGLSDFLETKRSSFSRFYFLSNEELLSILSESKDVKLVQPHLKKCFEGIVKVEFQEDLTITAMISAEGEQVAMATPVNPNGKNVEHWMTEVEDMMRVSIRAVMLKAIQDYTQVSRVKWIQKWPGMCVLNGSQFHWTREMEEGMAMHGAKGVQKMLEHQLAQLADMVVMVRGHLDKLARISVGALTVIDVHARDVTLRLAHNNVSTKDDFMWSSQLRYYWNDDLFAEMVSARRPYGYEYLGNSFRLVITPLTDKCYMTLMAALQMILGGAPAGPAGTGKTETTKDLAKALAKQCVVFNCSDGLDYIAMGKFFKGLASCGAWACFDEFNRINIEVLSVIGQQVTTLQLAIRANEKRIMFEGSDIAVSPQFGVFITMNPGYAGRSDLPDSLAALFRPVAMMVPDYAMIGEIMFFAYGYEKAKECGAKMVTTSAPSNCRPNPHMDEEVLLLRALQDVNLPKFLSFDIPLFNGIISDLFPGKSRPQLNLGALNRVSKLVIQRLKLQPHPFFMLKVVQLYETLCVRHGLMVVGATGGGKSSNLKVLCDTLTELKKLGEQGFAYEEVIIYQLNPKSITMGQLYGEFDASTHEWQDGILSTLYRAAASSTNSDRKWVIFDGPVDAIWIENMNTVLDDNKKLCLSSGEIIQMSQEMTMMFEVEDLSVASPATVSRTGMVYMEPASLGFDPLITSWLETLAHDFSNDTKRQLQWLFDHFVRPSMAFVTANVKEWLPQIPNNLCQSLMRLLDSFFAVLNGEEKKDVRAEHVSFFSRHIAELFVFCLVWSIGATGNEAGRVKFDAYIREEMLAHPSIHLLMPTDGLVYDYALDRATESWKLWLDTIPKYVVPAEASFSELVVPTSDSVRSTFLMQLALTQGVHMLIVGPTGTGKTINVNQFLERVDSDKFVPLKLTFSAQTSANQTQDFLDSKMEKRRKGVYGPTAGKKFIIHIDDLNMPKQEEYFAQPPIEILRQWFDQGGWYDRKLLVFRNIVDVVFVASMGPPGGGRNPITPRFLRHFNVIGYTEMSDDNKKQVFATIVASFLAKFSDELKQPEIGVALVKGSIYIYNTIINELLPTPAKAHYTFNLRDLAKVFQGVLMGDMKRIVKLEQLLRLWVHENMRVFEDRFTTPSDHEWFHDQLQGQLALHFGPKLGLADVAQNQDLMADAKAKVWEIVVPSANLIFGDYMIPGADPKIYEEITDMDKLVAQVEEYLNDYNAESSAPMNLVMFMNAIEHVSRIARIIRQPQGNALLLGVGGSGRQSLTRLAAYMAEYGCSQIEISKGYSVADWRDDLKKCLMKAGVEEKPTVFLFSDVQIVHEIMLEDINNILNTGDVPNLYAPEDIDAITNHCRNLCVKKRIAATKVNIFACYVGLVRQNLHLVLCMSPLGGTFRDRIRMFPSLVNCCTIDWFSEWPAQALQSVAMNALTTVDLKLGDQVGAVVNVFQNMHQTVEHESSNYFQKLRRYNYVTPTSYLELLFTFKSVLQTKRDEVTGTTSRLQNGVDKIIATKAQVAGMQEQLVALKPQLEKTQIEVEAMMVKITEDKKDADETKAVVEKEEQFANKKAADTKAIADDAQRDLDEALPALDAATQCLNKLKKSDIDEVKAMKNPPHGVRLTMEAACIIFGIKPTLKTDPDKPGQKIKDYWESAQKTILGNAKKLLEDMVKFDKDNIADKTIQQIDPYMEMEEFSPASVRKASVACEAICMWVRAMHTYNKIAKMVEPKKIALAEAQVELDVTMRVLADAKGRLNAVIDRLRELENGYNAAVEKKDQLIQDVRQCEIRLDSALKLISLLGGEEARWVITIKQLMEDLKNLVGDVVISSGTISYLGCFTSEFRDICIASWYNSLAKHGVPHTRGCNIITTLADPVKVRGWQIAGLPSDNLSVQNGIIMAKARRWPLLIDPQGQANRFIKNLGKETSENGIDVVKSTDKGFIKVLENGVRFGKWILMENVSEFLDAALETVLLQTKFKQGGQLMMKIGDTTIPYNAAFRFFMTTKLPNPHYPPRQQALGVVVQEEMPELAEKKNSLVVSNAKMKAELLDIENKILYMLANSQGNILDDTDLIEMLGKAKVTSEDINEKMAEAEVTEKTIDETRELYRGVANRASLLFFCIADLSIVDPMYQYSLSWFVELFIKSCRAAEPSDVLETRLANLIDFATYALYKNICRSLFEEHKLLFSFLLTIKLLQGRNEIDPLEWRFLISGSTPTKDTDARNPNPTWIEDRAWTEFCCLTTLPKFDGLAASLTQHEDVWRQMFDSNDPHLSSLPMPFQFSLNSFQKLCTLRCIRPDRMTEAIQLFVAEHLGQRFIEPPTFDLPGSYADSSVTTPLIFVLSTGSDPAKDLLLFADTMKMGRKLNSISLGQGQGVIAAKMIDDAITSGKWVLLQNCHLAISWMSSLERICEELNPETTHRDFRLWLTSRPSASFPTSVLQNGVKMTKEPPKGIRANLKNSYIKMTDEMLDATSKPETYRKLLFGLAFFHAVAIERKRFGPLGWNIPYAFNDTDYDISRAQLEMFLDFYDVVPYKVLCVMTSVVNYGGRVTDDKDMRTIDVILEGFFNDKILSDNYWFSKSGTYKSIPVSSADNPKSPLTHYINYIDSLPLNPDPEVFGMHENANITCAIAETFNNFDIILSLQPRMSSGGGQSREMIIELQAKEIEDKLPPLFDIDFISVRYPVMYEESMNTVLVQEAQRYNNLLTVMKTSLPLLQRALKGLVVMSADLETMSNCIFNQKVPPGWERKAYPSLKALNPWVDELLERLRFLTHWINDGIPAVFWLSGFFFPQGFLTGTLQNHARGFNIPIDTLSWDFIMVPEPLEAIKTKPQKGGCYTYGLFIEGARWDMHAYSLADPIPKELFSKMPVMHLMPVKHREAFKSGIYRCPVYKILTRTGTLSTTGHSTNFVMWIEIPSVKDTIWRNSLVSETNLQVQFADQDYWIKAGVACFLSLRY
ncbi:hypothetical protein Ae201684P_008767 [Aphanomyces euteiches]|nr:hypothetical protein Ae201684P_008767 [Aphanomyces euteiches]